MITAKITAEDAYDVALFLSEPLESRGRWQPVIDALFAIANDTDAIVTDDRVEKMIQSLAHPDFVATTR